MKFLEWIFHFLDNNSCVGVTSWLSDIIKGVKKESWETKSAHYKFYVKTINIIFIKQNLTI